MHGTNILEAEITHISKHGFWLFVSGEEYSLPFEFFPWFKKATIENINNFQVLHNTQLFWPSLDIDLHIDSIKNPRDYHLVDVSRQFSRFKSLVPTFSAGKFNYRKI
jgi:hypothetical protein